jgi:hypothetical protein
MVACGPSERRIVASQFHSINHVLGLIHMQIRMDCGLRGFRNALLISRFQRGNGLVASGTVKPAGSKRDVALGREPSPIREGGDSGAALCTTVVSDPVSLADTVVRYLRGVKPLASAIRGTFDPPLPLSPGSPFMVRPILT